MTIHVSFSYRDALLLGDGPGSRTTSPRSDVHHPHSASQLTNLKGNAIIHEKTKKSKQALPMNKISTKASASDDSSSNPKVESIVSATTPDTSSSIMINKKVTQVVDLDVKGMMTGATDSSMMKKDTTISSSLGIKPDEEIPSTFVNEKKNDHPSSTKEEYDSSSAIAINVEDKETDVMKTKKHTTAKALKVKEKQVETKKLTTMSSFPSFSDQSKEKFLNEQLKIEAAPLLADKNNVGIAHEPEAQGDSGRTTESFFSSIHHRKKSLASISNAIFSRGKTYSFGLKKASKVMPTSYYEVSLVQEGSKMMKHLKSESNLNGRSVKNEEGLGHDISSAGKKFINYEFFTPALFFEDVDGANNKAIVLKNIESLLFSVSKDPCSDDHLCCAFQWDGNQCLILVRDVSTKDITVGPGVLLHEDAEVQSVRTVKTTTTQHSTGGHDGRRDNDKIVLLEGMIGSLCSDSISLDEKKVILHNMERRFLRAAMISLTPAATPEHSDIVEVENRGKILDRFGASIIDDSSKISLNNDSFMLLRGRSFEIKTSKDYCKLNQVGDTTTCSKVERSGGLLSHKKKGGKAINFFPLGRKLWMHFLMVVVLIFVQSPDNFALGKEIEVDEEGSLVEVVDLTIQNKGRHLKSKSTKGSSKKGDLAEGNENSSSPSVTPTDFLSTSPSFNPSSLPSTEPTVSSRLPSTEPSACTDEPNWKYSVLDLELSNFRHLIGKTCKELEDETVPELHDDFCQGIALNTGQTKCVLEGCCFCGGGTLREVTCVDIGNWYVSETINCDYISKLKAVDAQKAEGFCELWKKFYSDDMKPSEACCACGGGKHVNSFDDFVQDQRRQLNEEEEANEDEDVAVGGVPNLEFLGIGYDALRGNPRGSSISELDPGFRYRVFNFQQSSGQTTLDGAYFVPKGTEFRYTSSCHYDSSSTEISSEKDYRESLSKESSFSNTLSVSAQGQYGIVAGKLETSVAWSESESYSSFKEKSVSENTVTFEAKAICSEFEVSFNPYSERNLDPNFKRALNKLSLLGPFDPKSIEHKREYRAFIDAYGTHYTKKVILGAKRILSTTMTSRDVAELTKDQVDISSTLSVDVQLAIGKADYVKDSLGGSFPDPPDDPTVPDYLVHVINKTTPAAATPAQATADPEKGVSNLGGSISNKYDKFTSSSKQTESANKISQKKIKTEELNFGGLPNVDWREWAASVKERPMPIMYENEGLWTLMDNEKQKEAFLAALYHLEGFSIQDDIKDAFIGIAHFGVATGSGDPLSESSVNPNASFRAMFQVDEIESKEVVKSKFFRFKEVSDNQKTLSLVQNYNGEKSWTSWAFPTKSNYYMCGARVDYDKNDGGDDEGILNVHFRFCKYGDWHKQSGYVRAGNDLLPNNEDTDYKTEICSTDYFVKKIWIRDCITAPKECSDKLGIHSLMIECCNPDDCENTIEYKEVHCDEKAEKNGGSNKPCGAHPDSYEYPVGPEEISDEDKKKTHTNLILAGRVLEGCSQSTNAKYYDNGLGCDGVAVLDMRIQWEEVKLLNPSTGGGAFDNIATYATVWKGKIDRPTAIFANAIRGAIVHNTAEEKQQYGFISYIKNKWTCDMDNNVIFGLSGDKISEDGEKSLSHGVFAISNFERQLEMSRLQSFSFATFENDPNLLDSIVTGVIRYDGVAVNTHGGRSLGFEVSQEEEEEEDETFSETIYNVAFTKGNMSKVKPIVLLFPEWYLDSQIYPSSAGQVSVALVKSQHDGKIIVKVGEKSGLDRSYLGFNFVAMDPCIVKKTKNYSIGTSSSPTTSTSSSSPTTTKDEVKTVKGSARNKANMEGDLKYTKITFSSSFKTLPTLIVTPIISTTDTIDNDNIPRCIIETLTKKSAVVKCDMLKRKDDEDDDGCNVTPIDFNYLAIGERVP